MTKIFSVLYLRLITLNSGSTNDEFQYIYPTGAVKTSYAKVDLVIAMSVAMTYTKNWASTIVGLNIATILRTG